MRTIIIVAAAVASGLSATAGAQSWQPPPDDQRCPSRWGAQDQRGSANLMTPETVLQAARLIRTGETFELGHVVSESATGGRRLEIYTKRTIMEPASNRPGNTEELVVADLAHIGTQIDGFAHQSIGNSMYNCFKLDEVATRTGFTKLGIENVGTLMTRGVLLDIAAVKGVDVLPETYEITVEDLQAALQRQNLTLKRADAILLYTGFSKIWPRSTKGRPGIGVAAAEWLAAQNPMVVGSDTGSVELIPARDPQLFVPVHQIMLAVHGIYLVEYLKLDELATKRVHEFALVLQPLKIKGSTGSTLAPVAIR